MGKTRRDSACSMGMTGLISASSMYTLRCVWVGGERAGRGGEWGHQRLGTDAGHLNVHCSTWVGVSATGREALRRQEGPAPQWAGRQRTHQQEEVDMHRHKHTPSQHAPVLQQVVKQVGVKGQPHLLCRAHVGAVGVRHTGLGQLAGGGGGTHTGAGALHACWDSCQEERGWGWGPSKVREAPAAACCSSTTPPPPHTPTHQTTTTTHTHSLPLPLPFLQQQRQPLLQQPSITKRPHPCARRRALWPWWSPPRCACRQCSAPAGQAQGVRSARREAGASGAPASCSGSRLITSNGLHVSCPGWQAPQSPAPVHVPCRD